MKKVFYKSLILLLLISACLLCFSCAKDTQSKQPQGSIDVEYVVKYFSSSGGQIQGNSCQIVKEGRDGEEIIAVPLDGYAFIEWSDGKTNSARKEYNVHDDINLTARFAKILSVEYSSDGNGYLDGDVSQSIIYGNDATAITAVPDTGYAFWRWSDGVTDNPRQDKSVDKPLNIKAEFTKLLFTLEYLVTDGGHIYSWSKQSVYYGEDAQSVTAVPEIGYEFVGWDDGKTNATRFDNNVTNNFTVTAIFKKKNYTVNYVAGAGGHIDGKKTQSVPYYEQTDPVTAVADDGYRFVGWDDGLSCPATRTDTILQDVTYTAVFEKIVYNVDYYAQNGGRIVGYEHQKVQHGEDSASVIAVADEGYEFVGWSDGVTDATRFESNVTKDFTITALFRKI